MILAAPRACGRGAWGAALFVLLLTAVLWAAHFALTFRGLEVSDAFNYAQVARNLARGRGYITQETLPYELLRFDGVPHPELLHPPLHALAVAVPFAIFGPHDWAVALPGGLAYVLTAPLIYLAAARFSGPGAAAVSAALFLTHPGSAAYAVSGLAESLYALVLTAALLGVSGAYGERRSRLSFMLVVGILLGLTDLARETGRYLLLVAIPLLWGVPCGRRARLMGLLAGYILVTLPNHVRIAAVTGNPFASYAPAVLMCNIPPFSGLDWYRSMSSIDPWSHLVRAPHLLVNKVISNLAYLAASLGRMVSPLLILGALAAHRLSAHPEVRRAVILTGVALSLQVVVTSLFLVDLRHFAPFVPMLAVLGGVAVSALWSRPGPWGRKAWRGIAIAGLAMVLVVQVPARIQQFRIAPAEVVARREAERELGQWVAGQTAAEDLVITDISEIIAWTADRRTVWYPLDETLLDRLRQVGRGREVLLLTSLQIKPDPGNARFGSRLPNPWLRYLEGPLAPPSFELVSEFRRSELRARLFRRSADSASSG